MGKASRRNRQKDHAAASKSLSEADREAAYKADQCTLHKVAFDRIIQKYKLDTPEASDAIAEYLTTASDDTNQVTSNDFAEKFGTDVEEAVVFLEWIKVGVKFKKDAAAAAQNSGLLGTK
mgnify:CR=1 FL=1